MRAARQLLGGVGAWSLVMMVSSMVRPMAVGFRLRSWFGFQVGFRFAGAAGSGFQQLGQGWGMTAGLPVAELVDHDQVGGTAGCDAVQGKLGEGAMPFGD